MRLRSIPLFVLLVAALGFGALRSEAQTGQMIFANPGSASTVTLTVTVTGTGAGSISDNVGQITGCTTVCTGTYAIAQSVTLTPTPTAGSTFGWSTGTGSANCTGSNPCTFNINQTSTVLAIFTNPPGQIQAAPYFGVDYNTVVAAGVSHGLGRFAATPHSAWVTIQKAKCVKTDGSCVTDPAIFDFSTGVDALLKSMLAAGVTVGQFAFYKIPEFATGAAGVSCGTFGDPSCGDYSCFSATVCARAGDPCGGSGNNGPGQCDPTTDIDATPGSGLGDGTNLMWRNFVAALVYHVKHLNPAVYATIPYWETYNEPDTNGFYNMSTNGSFGHGTYDQLIRMQEDLRCIVETTTGVGVRATGETCAQVRATVFSVPALGGPIDSTATIITGSYHGPVLSLPKAQCLLYCTPAYPNTTCNPASYGHQTCHAGGASSADAINFHLKEGGGYQSGWTAEQQLDYWINGSSPPTAHTQTPNITSILQAPELAKPFWCTEGGYNADGWTKGQPYTIELNQAAYIARDRIYAFTKGCVNNTWFDWTGSGGLGSAAANQAYTTAFNWMVGSTMTVGPTGCTLSANGSADAQNSGGQKTLYTCPLTEADGTSAQFMWDVDNTGQTGFPGGPVGSTYNLFWDTGAPNNLECHNSVCPTLNHTVGNSFQSWIDLTGAKHTISSHIVPVGIQPVLVQAKP